MNDHLAKPFRVEALSAMIAKWSRQKPANESSSRDAVAMDDLRVRFLKRSEDDCDKLQNLRGATGGGAEAELAFLIHRLAGTAGMFGFDEVGQIAGMLDMKIGEGGRVAGTDIDPLIAGLHKILMIAPVERCEHQQLARA